MRRDIFLVLIRLQNPALDFNFANTRAEIYLETHIEDFLLKANPLRSQDLKSRNLIADQFALISFKSFRLNRNSQLRFAFRFILAANSSFAQLPCSCLLKRLCIYLTSCELDWPVQINGNCAKPRTVTSKRKERHDHQQTTLSR
jgi:hypothetical protein